MVLGVMGATGYIQILVNGICTGGMYGLIASGFTFQVGALRMSNFSYGHWIMLSMYITYFALEKWRLGIAFAMLVIVPLFSFFGFITRRIFLTRVQGNSQILITMGIGLILINGTEFIIGGYPRSLPIVDTNITIAGIPIVGQYRLMMAILASIILLSFHLFLTKTWMGTAIRAVVQGKEVASLMGIPSDKMINVAFGLSYILVGVSGSMLLTQHAAYLDAGGYYQLMGFLICVIAGLGNLKMAYVAGLLIGVVSSFIMTFISTSFHDPIIFLLFIMVLLFKPNGLFNKDTARLV